MGYQKALEAAGAVITEYKEFGSYQGSWFALLNDGRLVEGSYGSCSGCDAYQAEFDSWNSDDEIIKQDDGKYYRDNRYWDEDEVITEEEAAEQSKNNLNKLKRFGQSYLNEAQTLDEALARYTVKVNDEYAWDEDKEIFEWLQSKKQ